MVIQIIYFGKKKKERTSNEKTSKIILNLYHIDF